MKPLIILLTVISVLAHIWLSLPNFGKKTQATLTEAVTPLLEQGYPGVSIHYDYLDATLEGEVAADATKAEVEKKVREWMIAGRVINRITVREATVPPWLLIKKTTPNSLTMEGRVPTEAIKSGLAAKLSAIESATIINRISVSPDVIHPKWLSEITTFANEFSTHTAAELRVEDNRMTLVAQVRNQQHKDKIISAGEDTGLNIVDQISLIPKKPSFLAAKQSDKIIRLTGMVASKKIQQEWTKQLNTLGLTIDNQVQVHAHTTPLKLPSQTGPFFASFFRGSPSAELRLDPQQISLKRVVTDLSQKQALLTGARKAFPQHEIKDSLSINPSSQSQDFGFSCRRQGKQLYLKGILPSLELRNEIIETAQTRFPSTKINTDNLLALPSANQTPDWYAGLPSFVAQLPNENFPKITFTPTGITPPSDNREKWSQLAMNTIGTQFSSFKVPVFGFHVKRKGQSIDLSGWLPDASIKQHTVSQIKQKLEPGEKLNDRVKIAPGMSMPAWGAKLPSFIKALPNLKGINGFSFNKKGLQAPANVMSKMAGAARKIFGKKFPGLPSTSPKPAKKPTPKKTAPVTTPSPTYSYQPHKVGANSYQGYFMATLAHNQVQLSGNLPDPNMKRDFESAVSSALPGIAIVNEIHIDKRVVFPKWAGPTVSLLNDFLKAQPSLAELEIDHEKIRLEQVVTKDSIRQNFAARAQVILPSARFIDQMTSTGVVEAIGELEIKDSPTLFPALPQPKKQTAPKTKSTESNRYSVFFATNSAEVDAAGRAALVDAANYISSSTATTIIIRGFTDLRGSYDLNKSLSDSRARKVAELLVTLGVPAFKIQSEGLGESQSSSRNNQAERRVDIVIN